MIIKQYIKDFEDLGFGMFVHFGLYSMLGTGEWSKHSLNIADEDYELLKEQFEPKKDWATELVKTAKNAECKYITLTTRHMQCISLYFTMNMQYHLICYGRTVRKKKKGNFDYLVDVIDWDKNVDPDFHKNRFMAPKVITQNEDYTEEWICYKCKEVSAKRLTIQPGKTVTIKDAAASYPHLFHTLSTFFVELSTNTRLLAGFRHAIMLLHQNKTWICIKSFKVSKCRLFKNESEFQDISVREFQN